MTLALKLLWRDLKGGELTLLLVSLLIAVSTVTSISIFADRIKNSIQDQASHLIAGDLQIRGSSEVPVDWRSQARLENLEMADILTFQAMAFSDSNMALASMKAVSNNYPLKGSLTIGSKPFVGEHQLFNGPDPGEVWLASRLFGALDVDVGESIWIGESEFRVSAALIKEPDSSQSFFGVGPRIMMNWRDIAATGSVQAGSRLSYRLVLAGEQSNLNRLKDWLEPQLGNHHRIVGVRSNDRSVGSTLDRAESFLLLAGSLGVILAGVALALASRRYSSRQANYVALLKTIGMTPNKIQNLYLINLSVIAFVGTILGLMMGWVIHTAIIEVFSGLLPENLAGAGNKPYLTGLITGFVSLIAFAAPPILALKQTSPARVLRQREEDESLSSTIVVGIGMVATIVLVYWYSQSIAITAALVGGLVTGLVCVGSLAWVIIRIIRKFGAQLGRTWRLGLASLQRHSKQNAMQIMIFSTSMMLLFVLTMVRGALIEDWQNQLPDDVPNHFVYNVFENDLPIVSKFILDNKLEQNPFYPMVRGRLININEQSVKERIAQIQGEQGDDYRRELNLTWSTELAADNELVAGDWWQPGDKNKSLVSIEDSFATALNIQVGDFLTFSIAGQMTTALVASIRTVQWDSLKPNFYVIFSNTILDGSAASYMTSFRLEGEQKQLLNGFVRALPTVSLIEIDAIIDQIRGIISQVSLAVEFILFLVLISGLLVLIASIQATLDDRVKESVILRTLGGQKSLVRGSLLIEFGTLGWLSGLMGVAGAEAVLYFLQSRVFDMAFTWHPVLWLVGPWIGMLIIAAVGMHSTKGVVRIPPLVILRGL